MKIKILIILLAPVLFVACGDTSPDSDGANQSEQVQSGEAESAAGFVADQPQESNRWYSNEQVSTGAIVFTENCAECHGPSAEGTVEDWRQRLDDGSFPPPPLNGSAHAWHHPTSMLLQVINNGGEAYGGKMPAFVNVLDDNEKLAAIAYFQNFWTDEIYSQWEQMGGTN